MIVSSTAFPRISLQISSYDNLRLVIYVLGRPAQGEMIVTLLKDNDEIKFSVLTDCYLSVSRHVKKFAKWCRTIGIDHFDAMIFTHPDVDHCTGVCELIKEMDADHTSLLFIPNQMFAVRNISVENVIKPFREVVVKYKEKGNFYRQLKDDRRSKLMMEIEIQTLARERSIMKFIQLATDEDYLFWHNIDRTNKATHNDISLVYTIYYNGQNYLYCADLPGEYVQQMDDEYLHNVRFVKIPHHGSKSCKELPSQLLAKEHRNVISATTTFHGKAKKKRLPHCDVLKRYNMLGDVYCTGPELSVSSNYEYGGIKIDCHLWNDEMNAICSGNAYQHLDEAF